ncbi:hypothetical protein B0H14DRAFT_3730887 [Mycena olivaceomarginata]|nr:hypothetical protein B0H14DRAFT_3730887 [Mycena olivaceomarginata]
MTVQQLMATSPTDMDPTQQVIVIPALPDTTRSSTSTGSFDSASSGTSVSRTVKPKPRTSAARRASHNAVERLRRENLNSRFLDLASLLPNLANIRRPTKSSIVNSCIAHVHASRRHRFLASQQLRALQEECESLRREANEWRDRAGVMLLPPPNRGEVFEIVLAGAEFELEDPPSGEGEGEEEEYGYGDEDGGAQGPRYTREDLARLEIYQHQQHQRQVHQFPYAAHPEGGHARPDAGQFQSPFAHNIPAAGPHSAEPDRWHDDHERPHTWYDDPPVAPHSAHEPVMRGPYMHRVHTHPPHLEQHVHFPSHAQQEQQPLSPLFASPEYPYDPLAAHQLPHGHDHTQQIALHGRDAHAQKWEFVPHSLPTNVDCTTRAGR